MGTSGKSTYIIFYLHVGQISRACEFSKILNQRTGFSIVFCNWMLLKIIERGQGMETFVKVN